MIDTSKFNRGDTVRLMPAGLDQQGRYETRWPSDDIGAAHAATEIGQDDDYSDLAGMDWLGIGVVVVAAVSAWGWLIWRALA